MLKKTQTNIVVLQNIFRGHVWGSRPQIFAIFAIFIFHVCTLAPHDDKNCINKKNKMTKQKTKPANKTNKQTSKQAKTNKRIRKQINKQTNKQATNKRTNKQPNKR